MSDLTGSATAAQAFDRCGNLVADDQFVYQYDAWNRLVMVGQRGTLTFDAQGEPSGGEAGPWLIQYTHDGPGRVIRKLLPWPQSPQTQQSEHYYYDGVRRIQETVTDPLIEEEEGGGPGDVPPPVGAEEFPGPRQTPAPAPAAAARAHRRRRRPRSRSTSWCARSTRWTGPTTRCWMSAGT